MYSKIRAEDIEICMLLKDEELLIEPVILELKKYFCKFSIIDQSSQDRTLEIVRDNIGDSANIAIKSRGYIFETGFARARNELTSMCRLPWVFHVDADEQIVAGFQDGLLQTDAFTSKLPVINVERRNLSKPAILPDTLRPSDTNQFPIASIERIPRIYSKDMPVIWKSFIHEEIVDSSTLSGCASVNSKIVLNHISQLKNEGSKEYKEELYGWMIVKGAGETGFREDKLSGYSEAVLKEHADYFREMARRFTQRLDKS